MKKIPSGDLVYQFPDICLQSSDLIMLQIKYKENTLFTQIEIETSHKGGNEIYFLVTVGFV
jgi:hypothetical protein